MTYKTSNAQILDGISRKKFQLSRPVHVIFNSDKLDYLGVPKTKFLTSDKECTSSTLGQCKVSLKELVQFQKKIQTTFHYNFSAKISRVKSLVHRMSSRWCDQDFYKPLFKCVSDWKNQGEVSIYGWRKKQLYL